MSQGEKKSMVQKEVKKKTSIYAIAAVMLAIVLVSMVYAFGSSPSVLPVFQISQLPAVSGMKTFSSIEELKNYLVTNTLGGSSNYEYSIGNTQGYGPAPMPTAVPATAPSGTNSLTDDHSTTNIQVAGVDEADTVKTDGQYIYTLSSTQNSGYDYYYGYSSQTSNNVYILSADPQNAKVVSKIDLGNNTSPEGLFLSQDSNRLVVLSSKYQVYSPIPSDLMIMPFSSDVSTSISVYDISNKANPVLTRNFTASGSYFNSRMIGNYVYAVTSQNAVLYNDAVTVPAVYSDGKEYSASPTSIYYADMNQSSDYSFTSFYGINIADDQQSPTNMTVLMSGASAMYVSPSNIYVTYPRWANGSETTSIYRVKINGLQLTFEAQGSVPGDVINQYAMDEYNGNFRIAVTTPWQSRTNDIYVLNSNLTAIGKLEGLANGESIYSARFMGDKCYLVTFKQTDPFFVIDLSNPAAPKVAGELKLPGYSSYLQPYDENHVIGVGAENTISSGAESSNLKLSLFDVTDINNPKEIAKYTVPGNSTSSNALYDPKALLFDLQKQLLVIPVSINNYYNNYTGTTGDGKVIPPVPQISTSDTTTITTESWQGIYVFNINTNSGFTLKGTVTHLNSTLLDNRGYLSDVTTLYNNQNNWITRSLYIGNTLYTVSNAEVKLNSLTDMSEITAVNLS
jgi:uncharacterized secreted protein with C-terminal beta-propeller domain